MKSNDTKWKLDSMDIFPHDDKSNDESIEK